MTPLNISSFHARNRFRDRRSASGEIIEINESEAVRRDFMIDSTLRGWMERKVSVDLPVVDLREEYKEIHNRDGEKPDIVFNNR